MRRVHVQTVSFANIAITIALAIVCAILFWQGRAQFNVLQQATEAYISCENDAQQVQDRSDHLTEQVRLVTMTAKPEYIDNYFSMANSNEEFDEAFADLKSRFEGTDAYESLRTAMDESNELMNTEFYAMRLICEANDIDPSPWPEIASCQISDDDSRTSHDSMIYKAQNLVSDSKYQEAKDSINSHTTDCIAKVTDATIGSQDRAASIFDGIYGTIEACIAIYIALTLIICALVRRAVVKPLLSFGDSIKANQLFPVQGAGELQVLAETYNRVFTENEATHMIVKHQAEHDPLTDLLNRGSFDKALKLHNDGKHDFALILADVDQFKSVNDTFGHAVGDQLLKRVSSLLQVAFRSTDFVCRIGGDEFAVIMVDVTSDLRHIIQEKIDFVNTELSKPIDGMPQVSLSAGAAFADRPDPGDSIYKDADDALYHTKENGRSSCSFFGEF